MENKIKEMTVLSFLYIKMIGIGYFPEQSEQCCDLKVFVKVPFINGPVELCM